MAMTVMSGAAMPSPPEGHRSPRDPLEDALFKGLVVSDPPKIRRGLWMPASTFGHVVAILAMFLVPIFWPSPLPENPDYIRALIYDPPPPPPPPLPKGSAILSKPEPAKPVTPDPVKKPEIMVPVEKPVEAPIQPEDRAPESEQQGSETGSDLGVAEGMEGGVEGGQVGGVPGGVLGGVVGGTGDGAILDYDHPPRPIRMTRPHYPQDAFIKKIEGVVLLEILIDSNGRVIRARVLQSVPALDAAAIQTVKEWVFSPAIKHGRPVATIAQAPVAFRIF
jgi:protein TonB